MKPVIYIAAIGVTLGGAAVSFLNSEQHKALLKETYDLAKENDALEKEIDQKKGKFVNIEDYTDSDQTPKTVQEAMRLRFGRAITGYLDWRNVKHVDEREEGNKEAYKVGDMTFETFNNTAKDKEGEQYKYITFAETEGITDIKSGEAVTDVTAKTISALKAREAKLAEIIGNLESDVASANSDLKKVEARIAEYKAAEKRIQELFAKEGLKTLQDGKDKLVELEARRKDRINEVETLTVERDGFKDKLTSNEKKIEDQKSYFAKRKVNLSVNEKKFPISSVNFDWGFAVIKHDDKQKFFVNQKLMVLRSKRYIGDLSVSAVEPGRIICNIEYNSIRGGEKFRKGDLVILAEPADR